MQVKVVPRDMLLEEFSTLPSGACFMLADPGCINNESQVWLKCYHNTGQAVRLSDGLLSSFGSTLKVVPVKASVTVNSPVTSPVTSLVTSLVSEVPVAKLEDLLSQQDIRRVVQDVVIENDHRSDEYLRSEIQRKLYLMLIDRGVPGHRAEAAADRAAEKANIG